MELLAGVKSPDETTEQIKACNCYLELGRRRTLPAFYKLCLPNFTFKHSDIRRMCNQFDWLGRAEYYDELQETLKQIELDKEFDKTIVNQTVRYRELINIYKSLQELKEQAENDLFDDKSKKKLGGDILSIIKELRAILSQIRDETGGTTKKIALEHTVKTDENKPDLSLLTDDELNTIWAIYERHEGGDND